MSKSYKKYPWCCDRNPWAKNYANRIIRHGKPSKDDIPDGKAYRKYNCPWDICEYKSYKPFWLWRECALEEIAEDVERGDVIHGYRTSFNYWEKCFKRK